MSSKTVTYRICQDGIPGVPSWIQFRQEDKSWWVLTDYAFRNYEIGSDEAVKFCQMGLEDKPKVKRTKGYTN
jgi:hypothetical protein